MIVLRAMILDAYRELNSRRLFWITLVLSALIVLVYASIGFDDKGMSVFFGLMKTENELLTHGSPMASVLYRSIFSTFMVSVWLAWIATILALISTTTLFPDFIAGGAIDLVLSKPIGRIRLFFNKYLASLLFVLLQVTVFCVGVFLCMGIRIGEWDWKILLAIPIVLAFYSYLYSVNVLVGVWTRSSLSALLLTLLFWFSLFGVNMTEALLNQVRTDTVVRIEEQDKAITNLEASIAALPKDDGSSPTAARLETQLDSARTQRETMQEAVDNIDAWHGPALSTQALLPKTNETIALLDRWLKKDTDVNLLDLFRGQVFVDEDGRVHTLDQSRHREVERRMEDQYESRSLAYVLGTSFVFEGVVLGLACFIFARRDY